MVTTRSLRNTTSLDNRRIGTLLGLIRELNPANISQSHANRERKTHSFRHCFPMPSAHLPVNSIADEQCVRPRILFRTLPNEQDRQTYVSARTAIPALTAKNTTPPHSAAASGACAGADSVCVAYRYPAVAVPSATVVEHSVKRSLTRVSVPSQQGSSVSGSLEGSSQSSKCPLWRRPTSPTARRAEGQNASPVTPTYTNAYPFSCSSTLARKLKMGVSADKNVSGPGRMLLRGCVI